MFLFLLFFLVFYDSLVSETGWSNDFGYFPVSTLLDQTRPDLTRPLYRPFRYMIKTKISVLREYHVSEVFMVFTCG